MYFKRLEIFGFKSFAEKTVFEFQSGITAVVGPNGCGKSNVFDAIRWVLGEQSAKDLRGSAMEDVIFSGTDRRPPLGFAEVNVVFSNEHKVLPIEYDEVIVTRRLFRSGESEYLLNKNVCRLKDIVELFLGTGIGAEAYSLIQQGKVDLVVSAKPDDRRQIFDEAAGITKYKTKKREALNKLKETEDNLLRINDIVVEVKRQIATIERQAKKAQKYKEEFEELKKLELILSQRHLGRFTGDLFHLTEETARLQAQEAEWTTQLQELNNRLEHATDLIEELDEQINALKAKHMRLENDIDINTRQIVFNEERLANIDSSCAQLEQDKIAALDRCKTNQSKIEEIKAALDGFNESLALVKSRLQLKKEEIGVSVHAINEAQQSIKIYEQEQFALNARDVRVKNQLTDHMKRRMELSSRRHRLEQENNKVSDEQAQIGRKCESINAAITAVNTEAQEAWNDLNSQRQALEQGRLRLAAVETAIDDLEKAKVFLMSQKEFIAKMQVQYHGIPDPVVEGKFICAIRPLEKQTGIIGKIKNIREIPGDGTKAAAFEITYETKYIELDLAHMDERISGVEGQLAAAIEGQEAVHRDFQAQQQAVDRGLNRIQDLEKKMSVFEAQKNDIELETGKIVGEIHLITSEFSQIGSDLAALAVLEEEENNVLNGISSQIRHCQEDIKLKQGFIAVKHKEREDLNVAIVQLEAEVQAAVDKQMGFEENLSVYAKGLDRDLSDFTRFEGQIQESEAKKRIIHEDISRLNELIAGLHASGNDLSAQLDGQMALKTEMTQRLSSLRQQAKVIEDEVISLKTNRHNLDMRQQEIYFNQRSLKERFLQVYKIDLDSLSVAQESVPAGEPASSQVNDEELSLEIERLKKRCESYGAVNLVAIEEFEELRQRFEFLTKQQSDLLSARESLMQTIQKINRTTRQMFTDTFTKVNEEFQVYFRMLFGGGEAQLVLLDPENALESGIDIVARPPGKKPQHISLLSGGEKTLTAIALIFGVFKVNPSPFCVLDEIDAALDESNVGRFTHVLKEFAKIAQFIVITHNKKTMEGADILYGVTMPERGISRIVSVKFNSATSPVTQGVLQPAQATKSQPAIASV